jgi:hypothetical protein
VGDSYDVLGLPTGAGTRPEKFASYLQKREVVLAFDGDAAGRAAIRAWHPALLQQGCTVRVIPMPDGADLARSGDLSWVSGPTRPDVDAFFRRYAARTAILNGLEVRSIAHERCERIVMTGSSDPDALDIPSRIAAGAAQHLPLAHLVVSGPAYLNAEAQGVVRMGGQGQLAGLLSGTCMAGTSPALNLPSQDLIDLEDAYVRGRVEAFRAMGTEVGRMAAEWADFFERFDMEKYGSEGAPLHDPTVIAYLLKPELFKGRHINVEIETTSELTMGMTVADWWGVTGRTANARFIRKVDADAFFALLCERLANLP